MSKRGKLLAAVEKRLDREGWRTDRSEVGSGVYQIAALHPESETRRLLLVVTGADRTVPTDYCTWLSEQAENVDAERVELVAAGPLADGVDRLARERGISIVDASQFDEDAERPRASENPGPDPRNERRNDPAGAERGSGGAAGSQGGRSVSDREQTDNSPPGGREANQQQRYQQSGQYTQDGRTEQRRRPPDNRGAEAHGVERRQGGHPEAQPRDTRRSHPQQPQQAVTGQPRQNQRTSEQPPPQSGGHQHEGGTNTAMSTGANVTRLATCGGGVLGGISLFLPWVVATQGNQTWNGMSTEMSTVVVVAAAVAVVLPLLSWGSGWGRLSALLTGGAGAVLGYIGFAAQEMINVTRTIGHIELDGREIPLAAVESGTGVEVVLIAGAVVIVASLGGLAMSFR